MPDPVASLMDFLMPNAYAEINPKGVAYTESRGMTKAQKLKQGPAGELGTYQITPPAFRDLQRLMPEKYGKHDFYKIATDDQLAQEALMDYMGLLKDHYAKHWNIQPTDPNLLQMYNLGPGAFRRGKRNPAYVNTYYQGLRR